jgi:putative membrane protein
METARVNIVSQLAVLVASLIHVMIFVMESVLFTRASIHKGTFGVAGEDLPAVRQWAFNQGFYNLFLALGGVAGLIALHAGSPDAGRALVALSCGSMLAAAAVLLATNRKMVRAAAIQGLAPLIALVFLLV